MKTTMNNTIKLILAMTAGAVASTTFMLACGRAGSNANASPSDCTTWQSAFVQPSKLLGDTSAPTTLPTGWEPYAGVGTGVLVRRCSP